MSSQRSGSFRPNMEMLEDRVVPAVSFQQIGSSVIIEGDNVANVIRIVDNGDGDIEVWGDGAFFQADNIDSLEILTNFGDDKVIYTQEGDRTRDMQMYTHMGGNQDYFAAYIRGDILNGRTLDVETWGGEAEDGLAFVMDVFKENGRRQSAGVHEGGNLNVELYGDYTAIGANPGDGLANNDDAITVLWYHGILDGNFDLMINGHSGNDSLFADLEFHGGSTGQIQADMLGGSGDDTMQFYFSKTYNNPGMSGNLDVNGGTGKDTCIHSAIVSTLDVEDDQTVF